MNIEDQKSESSDAAVEAFTYDRNFQEKILQAMIVDHVWSSQFVEVLEVKYFQSNAHKLIASQFMKYHQQYKEFPSTELLITIIKNELQGQSIDDIFKDQIKSFFVRVASNTELGDLPYVKKQALDFCKKARLTEALFKAVDLAKNAEHHDKIVEELKRAVAAGNEHTPGLSLVDDIDARYSETYRHTIPTGLERLDHRTVLNGGLGGGEIGFIVAASGVGKSQVLVHLGAEAIKRGKNVIHYTFELNERNVGIRYDSNLLDISSTDCFEHKDEIRQFYKDNEDTLGKLRIKYYPTSTVTVSTLRTHIEKLAATGFRPDMIIVDYAGIMRSSEKYDLLRLELKKVCEELRAFAAELNVPVWTALQSNKEGANSDIVDMTNLAESFAMAHVADFIMGLARPSKQKSTGLGNIFIAKNRAGIDGIKFNIHLDTSRSRLTILEDDFDGLNQENDEEEGALNFVRKKVNQLRSQP